MASLNYHSNKEKAGVESKRREI